MRKARYQDPSKDEEFYAHALAILVGPSRTMALVMRLCNLTYWLAVIAALAWLLAQAIDRNPPVRIRAAELITPTVRPGEPVKVRYDVQRFRTCQTDLNWSIYDGAQEVHSFGPTHVEAPGKPGADSMVRAWSTPSNAAPGPARLRVILSFECPGNYLQAVYPVSMVLDDVPFTLKGRDAR